MPCPAGGGTPSPLLFMNVDFPHLVALVVVIVLGGVIQSAVGFAYALFATPLLLYLGFSLPHTIAIVGVSSFVQAVLGTIHLRADVPWRLSLAATGVRAAAVVLGWLILRRLAELPLADIKWVVGSILCILVGVQALSRVRPGTRVHWAWGALAFSASGLLAGVCGMGGPPLVLWALAHDWSAAKTRSFLFAVFALTTPVPIVLLCVAFGLGILRSVLLGIALTPAVFLGAALGLPLGNRIHKPVLRTVAYLILLALGASAIIQGLLERAA